MAQVTIYISNDLESQIKAMASSLNISISIKAHKTICSIKSNLQVSEY